jgi:hypothetical protein
VAIALLGLLACSEAAGTDRPPARSELIGVVVEIESAGLGEVESFTLKQGTRTFEIFIDPGAAYSFPPAHLHNHLATAQPVRVEAEGRAGRLVATSIEDA